MEVLLVIIVLVLNLIGFWIIIRVVRAIERIADNLGTIGRAHTRSAEAIGRIANNENARE